RAVARGGEAPEHHVRGRKDRVSHRVHRGGVIPRARPRWPRPAPGRRHRSVPGQAGGTRPRERGSFTSPSVRPPCKGYISITASIPARAPISGHSGPPPPTGGGTLLADSCGELVPGFLKPVSKEIDA